MNRIMEYFSQLELSTGHMVALVIFFLYILGSCLGFALIFSVGKGYLDLAKGLRKILDREKKANRLEDIAYVTEQIRSYFDSYSKRNPSVGQAYGGIVEWMDDILLQTNLFSDSKRGKKKRFGVWFDEYYETLRQVRDCLRQKEPYYRCTSGQAQILKEITALETPENREQVAEILSKTEGEFSRVFREGRKNERSNYISIAIGVAGILVSVLLTVLQMIG